LGLVEGSTDFSLSRKWKLEVHKTGFKILESTPFWAYSDSY